MGLSMTNETTRVLVSAPEAVIVFLEQEITKTLPFVGGEDSNISRVEILEDSAPTKLHRSEP
jgi:hypothetical protein